MLAERESPVNSDGVNMRARGVYDILSHMNPGFCAHAVNETILIVHTAEFSRISIDRGLTMMILGLALMGLAMAFDLYFRVRMLRRQYRRTLFRGGVFDYKEYEKVRREYGWAGWPVYLMWAIVAFGIAAFIAGFLIYAGTHTGQVR